ncbi:MAG: hypothetical protein IJM21_07505 [Clostridia bacterium]|nr:hypothetical protein [Clostridia bacterium]
MKTTRIVSLILLASLLFALCACEGDAKDGGKNLLGGKKTGEGASPADVSEAAMENFVAKLEAGNYRVAGGQGPTTNVVSPEQVYVVYGEEGSADVFAFMTLKGETFETKIERGSDRIEDVTFVSTDSAVDVAGGILPNSWIGLAGGNMWEFFYNDPNAPLEFTANDMNVKTTLAALGGYGEFTLSRMEEVHMILDAEDPTSVRFTAVVTDAGSVKYDDLDLTLTFGAAKSHKCIDQWLKKPVYPATRTSWTEDDIIALDQVFFKDYGEKVLPFPAVSSYAMSFDPNAFRQFSGILLVDPHWTEKDVGDYKALLKSHGYKEETGTRLDGSEGTVYRLLLREAYKACAQLEVSFDKGLRLVGTLYHEQPEYEGREAIGSLVEKKGFASFPETDVLTGWKAKDTTYSTTESWSYYFDYNFYMAFTLGFRDRAAAKAYLGDYAEKLLAKGFVSRFIAGGDNGQYTSTNGCVEFQYKFSETDDVVALTFKDKKSLTPDEVLQLLRDHGLPEADIHGDIAAWDVARYRYEIGEFHGLFLLVYQPYASAEEAEKYLDSYVPAMEEQGYVQFDPLKVGSVRQFVYFNEDLRKYVGFDLLRMENGAQIFFEFVSIEPDQDAESFLMKTFSR